MDTLHASMWVIRLLQSTSKEQRLLPPTGKAPAVLLLLRSPRELGIMFEESLTSWTAIEEKISPFRYFNSVEKIAFPEDRAADHGE